MRARDHGIILGFGEPGPLNAITDVRGVRVGHTTLIKGDGPLVVGVGPIRTGVTVIVPHEGEISEEPLFAGCHCLNGNGELTGLEWVRESGLLTSPIALTNSHSVGVVRDALTHREAVVRGAGKLFWSLPVVGETWDGLLNDINGHHVTSAHVDSALASAGTGAVLEGSVGGGTGMVCHEFKGGCGTASRVVAAGRSRYVVGVLVQANHGARRDFRVNGAPIGQILSEAAVPLPDPPERLTTGGAGSIIAVVATDAPLIPHQLSRLAQRAGLGVGSLGSHASHYSGELFLAFSTANRGLPAVNPGSESPDSLSIEMLSLNHINALFSATVEATEEAILNSLLTATTMAGRDGVTAHALDGAALVDVLERFGRLVFDVSAQALRVNRGR